MDKLVGQICMKIKPLFLLFFGLILAISLAVFPGWSAETVSNRGLASMSFFNTAISVPDVNASVEWYQRVLGFRPVSQADLENGASFAMIKRNDVIIELLKVQDQQAMPMLNQDPPNHLKYLGVKNFCLWVDDMDSTMRELKAQNVKFVWEALTLPEVGTRVTMIRDNNDNLIALWERKGRVWQELGRP
jgi:catechol 2,3-dioxygenase-like lactoylglutathione lyase family enzyme